MKVYSEFLKVEIDMNELADIVSAQLGQKYRLQPLAVRCTYPVFRGEDEWGNAIFVKVGSTKEWQATARLQQEIVCEFFAKLLVITPIEYRGCAVFVTEWTDSKVVFPEDFDDKQIVGFVEGCRQLSLDLQSVSDFVPISDSDVAPERLYSELVDYAERHPLAAKFLSSLLSIPPNERTFDVRRLSIIHGDFHAKNFGFSGDRLAKVFDFDKLTQSLACGDLVNALMERFSLLGLSKEKRECLRTVTQRIFKVQPWPIADLQIVGNVIRLQFAIRRIRKHPNSSWIVFDILRRDFRLREFIHLCKELQ